MNKLSTTLADIIREDELEHKRYMYLQKNKKLQYKIYDLRDKAEKRWLRNPIADYEEVVYIINGICDEMRELKYSNVKWLWCFYHGMSNSDLEKEYKYCDKLVNTKKKITEW